MARTLDVEDIEPQAARGYGDNIKISWVVQQVHSFVIDG